MDALASSYGMSDCSSFTSCLINPQPVLLKRPSSLPGKTHLAIQEQALFSPFPQSDDIVLDLPADAKLKLEAASVLNGEAAALAGTVHQGPEVDE